MQQITKIAQQKNNKQRYNIYLNEVYACSVSEDVLVKNNLYKGLALTEEEIETLKQEDAWQKTYTKALTYIQYRMRTKLEVRKFLLAEEVPEAIVNEIIEKLTKERLINDLHYAEAFVRDRKNFSTKGPLLIALELAEKGVSEETIAQALERFSEQEQIDNALKWSKKQLCKKSRHSYRKRIEQLKENLRQKGFPYSVIDEVVSRVLAEPDANMEMENLMYHAEKLKRKYEKKYTDEEMIIHLKAALFRRGFSSDVINEYIAQLENSM